MRNVLATVAILTPLAVYLWAAFRAKRPDSYHDFFHARQQISDAEFANSSVAYGLQIATISVFLAWGYLHPLPALINSLFWGIGILIFLLFAKRLVPYIESKQTLHGFLGDGYKAPQLRSVAAFMTVVGFWGLLLAEILWGSQVFNSYSSDPGFPYIVTFGIGVFVLVYFMRGGQLSVIHTDQFQLSFAYVGILGTALWISHVHLARAEPAGGAALTLNAGIALILVLIFLQVRRTIRTQEAKRPHVRFAQSLLLAVISVSAILFAIEGFAQLGLVSQIPKALSDMNWTEPGVDTWSLLSLILLPIFWQFIDFTMWQRIGALELAKNADNESYDLTALRKGLLRYAVESPLTWILGLSIGILLRFSDLGFDSNSIWLAFGELPGKLDSNGIGGSIVGAAFVLGIVAIMLSTVDSSLVGSTTALIYDLIPGTRRIVDTELHDEESEVKVLSVGKLAASAFVLIGLAAYYILNVTGLSGDQFLSLLFGAYGAQLAFAPAVIGLLLLGEQRSPSGGWASISTIAGFAAGLYATAISLSDVSWQLYPPLFALAGSCPLYLLGMLFKRSN